MGPGPRSAYLAAEGYLPNGNGRLPSQAMAPSFMLRCEALVAADEDGAGARNHWLPSIQTVAAALVARAMGSGSLTAAW